MRSTAGGGSQRWAGRSTAGTAPVGGGVEPGRRAARRGAAAAPRQCSSPTPHGSAVPLRHTAVQFPYATRQCSSPTPHGSAVPLRHAAVQFPYATRPHRRLPVSHGEVHGGSHGGGYRCGIPRTGGACCGGAAAGGLLRCGRPHERIPRTTPRRHRCAPVCGSVVPVQAGCVDYCSITARYHYVIPDASRYT